MREFLCFIFNMILYVASMLIIITFRESCAKRLLLRNLSLHLFSLCYSDEKTACIKINVEDEHGDKCVDAETSI